MVLSKEAADNLRTATALSNKRGTTLEAYPTAWGVKRGSEGATGRARNSICGSNWKHGLIGLRFSFIVRVDVWRTGWSEFGEGIWGCDLPFADRTGGRQRFNGMPFESSGRAGGVMLPKRLEVYWFIAFQRAQGCAGVTKVALDF